MADRGTPPSTTTRPRSTVGTVVGVLGLVLHCTVVAYLYLVSGLVTPWYGLLALWLAWLALLLLAMRWLRGPRPALTVIAPGLAVVIWIGLLTVGGAFFEWRA